MYTIKIIVMNKKLFFITLLLCFFVPLGAGAIPIPGVQPICPLCPNFGGLITFGPIPCFGPHETILGTLIYVVPGVAIPGIPKPKPSWLVITPKTVQKFGFLPPFWGQMVLGKVLPKPLSCLLHPGALEILFYGSGLVPYVPLVK